MSHLIFGICSDGATSALRRCAETEGIFCYVDAEIPQHVATEMLDEQWPRPAGARFMLVARKGDDTSDQLVSPYLAGGADGAIQGIVRALRWAMAVSADARVVLFFTEGYDDNFEVVLPGEVVSRIQAEQWVPSMRVVFEKSSFSPLRLEELRVALDLRFESQDWGIANADGHRVAEFISFYEGADRLVESQRHALGELVTASMNDAFEQGDVPTSLVTVFRDFWLRQHGDFPEVTTYWSSLDSKEFPVVRLLRLG